MQSSNFYCVKCRKVTPTENVNYRQTVNNRTIMVGNCPICGITKSLLVKTHTGKSIVNNLLNSGKLPELHLPGHNFTGPGTHVEERLLRGDEPINKLDKAAREHDIMYKIFKKVPERHIFDKRLQDEATKIMLDPESPLGEKTEAALVAGTMYGKRKLGLGEKKKT